METRYLFINYCNDIYLEYEHISGAEADFCERWTGCAVVSFAIGVGPR